MASTGQDFLAIYIFSISLILSEYLLVSTTFLFLSIVKDSGDIITQVPQLIHNSFKIL